MALASSNWKFSSAERRLQKELQEMMMNPLPELKVDMEAMEGQLQTWYIDVTGPEGTLYAGEKFRLRLDFGSEFPWKAPQIVFTGEPKPIHPHVYSNGHICLSLLGDDWTPALSVTGLCLSIISMLSSCKKKVRPVNDDSYVRRVGCRSPQHTKWIYHDDTC